MRAELVRGGLVRSLVHKASGRYRSHGCIEGATFSERKWDIVKLYYVVFCCLLFFCVVLCFVCFCVVLRCIVVLRWLDR